MARGEIRDGIHRVFRLPLRTRRESDADADEELRAVYESRVEYLVARGIPPAAARAEAAARLGGPSMEIQALLHHSAHRRERHMRLRHLSDHIYQDVRYALRGLRLQPAFAVAVVLILGLGMGASTAMFQIVDRLLFRPPSFLRDPSRTNQVYLDRLSQGKVFHQQSIQYRRYQELTAWTSSFAKTAAVFYPQAAVGTGEDARVMRIGAISASTFDLFSARPVLGRFFTAAEDSTPAGREVVVLGDVFWKTQYGADRGVVGRQLQIGPRSYTIIGVAPPGFTATSTSRVPALFIPITSFAYNDLLRRSGSTDYFQKYNVSWMEMYAVRRADVTSEKATTDLTQAFVRSYRADVAENRSRTPIELAKPHATLGPVLAERGPNQSSLSKVALWLVGVAGVVLLIACANVANLLLARALRRRREMAVRLALGVSSVRLLGQLLVESLLLAVLGAAAGLALAQWGGSLLRTAFLPDSSVGSVLRDSRTLWFALAATIIVALLSGLAPVVHTLREDVSGALKAGVREGSYHRSRMRVALLVAQGALSVLLLIGAGLFVRSLGRLNALSFGYDAQHVVYVAPNMRGMNLDSVAARQLRDALLTRAHALPGVVAATRASTVPFYQEWDTDIYVPGLDTAEIHKLGTFAIQTASPAYFTTMGTRLLRGRTFTDADGDGAPRVMIVSEAMAKALWPGQDALGKCVRAGADTAPCQEVVGIAETIRSQDVRDDPGLTYYMPIAQADPSGGGLLVRVRGDGAAAAERIRRELQHEMPGISYVTATPLTEYLAPALRSWRLGATMFSIFGMLALLLAAFGLYSVIAYNVAQRSHDIGVRMALGARAGNVARLVLGEGLRLSLVGVAIGALIAFALAGRIGPLLYGVSPRDPFVYLVVCGVLLGTALAACLLPALRASRVDPAAALRSD